MSPQIKPKFHGVAARSAATPWNFGLKAFGARNIAAETPFAAVAGGSVPVSFSGAFAGEKDTLAVCTVSSTAATPTFALPSGHSGLKVVSSAWRTNDDGTRTLELKFAKLGFVISFH